MKHWKIVINLLNNNGEAPQNDTDMVKKSNTFAGKVTEGVVQRLLGCINKHVRAFIVGELK
jgi:hypothetical protein